MSNPFPGLRPFAAEEASLFFGRDEQVEELLYRLASQRFLAVVGTSGSGKSSLVRAGLLPILQRGYLGPSGTHWVIATISRPGLDPLHGLACALVEGFGLKASRVTELQDVLIKSSSGLAELAKAFLQKRQRLLLLVDQFEDIFRYRTLSGVEGQVKSTAFVKLLLASTGHSEFATAVDESSVCVVLTMRSEYLGKCAQFHGLPEALNYALYLVPQMSRDQLREAIQGPIALAGSEFTDKLVDRMLDDVGGERDRLPLLQHALLRLWEESTAMSAKGEGIDLPAYDSIGGISSALNLDVEAVFNSLNELHRQTARRTFQRLVEPGAEDDESRRPTRLSELARVCGATELQVREVVEAFRKRGLLALSNDDDPLVDISHESLIRHWKRLRKWVKQESQSASIYRRLVDAAIHKRAQYRNPDLEEALRWERDQFPNDGWAARYHADSDVLKKAIRFLRRSQCRRRAERLGLVLGVLVIWAVITLLLLYLRSEDQRKLAEAQRQFAEQQRKLADSRHLAAAALLHRNDQIDLASLLSIQAFQIADTFEARSALLEMNQSHIQVLTSLYQPSAVKNLAFSRDGRILASAGTDQTIRLWDLATGKPLGEPLRGHTDSILSVSFSPDDKTLASAGMDETIRLWDVASGKLLDEPLHGHSGSVLSASFSPDGKILASAGTDQTIRLWNVVTGEPMGEPLRGHTDAVFSVTFSPDGKKLASAGKDKTVRLWLVATHRRFGKLLKGHSGFVTSVAFSFDNKTLASGSADKTVRLWDVATHRPIGKPLAGHSSLVNSVVFSPDGKILASAGSDKTVRLWNVTTREALGEPLRSDRGSVENLAFSPNGRLLASASSDKTIHLWDIHQPIGGMLSGHTGVVYGVAFSPDGKTFASCSEDRTVRFWSAITHHALGEPLLRHTDIVFSVAFSPDGKILASAGKDRGIWLWDVATHQPLGEPLQGHDNSVYGVAFSADGRVLASGSADKTVRLWDVATHQPLGEPLSHGDFVKSVAFSPDNRMLASASKNGTIKLWDLATRKQIGEPLKGHTSFVNTVVFSPDGKMLISGSADKTVRLWDIATRQPIGKPLMNHTDAVVRVALSPDGKTLATASIDRTISLWDVATFRLLAQPLSYSEPVEGVAFSADGKTLAAVGDKLIWLLDVDSNSWKTRGCQRANRDLSVDEWRQYIGTDVPYSRTCPEIALQEKGAPNRNTGISIARPEHEGPN